MRLSKRTLAWAASAVLVLGTASRAQAQVPSANQAVMLLRILAYDRKLGSRAQNGVVHITVVYKEGSADSETTQRDLMAALVQLARKSRLGGFAVQVSSVPFVSLAKVESQIVQDNSHVLYVCPGLNDQVPALAHLAQTRSVLTFAGVDNFVTSGLAVGIVRRADHASILVNLPASRAQGADLDSGLLSIAEVVR